MALSSDLVDGYLARLGLEREPPTADALARIQRAHVERVPWETVWIHEGRLWDIDPAVAAERIAATGRGGYCLHLNGALAALLGALGYRVTGHVGGVHGPDGPDGDELTNHLALGVHDLPTDTCPEGVWYVDAGLGDAMYEPAVWGAGPLRQPPFTMAVEAVPPGGVADWHLLHDPSGAFAGMSFEERPTTMAAFADRHLRMSTSPDSGFVKVLTAQRRTATTATGVRGLVHTVVSEGNVSVAVVDQRDDWCALLADGFGIVLNDARSVWDLTVRAHEAWAASG